MVTYELNEAAVEHARTLVAAGRVDRDRPWHEIEPTAADENAYLAAQGWPAYGAWFLGLREGADPETKERYGFVCGDFRVVSREGLVAIAQRAGEWHHPAIERAAQDLLALVDGDRD